MVEGGLLWVGSTVEGGRGSTAGLRRDGPEEAVWDGPGEGGGGGSN